MNYFDIMRYFILQISVKINISLEVNTFNLGIKLPCQSPISKFVLKLFVKFTLMVMRCQSYNFVQ